MSCQLLVKHAKLMSLVVSPFQFCCLYSPFIFCCTHEVFKIVKLAMYAP